MIRLTVTGLQVAYGDTPVLHGIDLSVAPGETVALVGESGSGKSTLALAVMRLLPPSGRITGGQVTLGGETLSTAPDRRLDALRGSTISMVFQQPRDSLHPTLRAGAHIAEVLRLKRGLGRREARQGALAWLERVGIRDTRRVARLYPHELSGGMAQRVALAAALAPGPRLLIADEPTSALDATVQARILDLLRDLRAETGVGLLLITHDMGVVGEMADRVAVLEDGKLVESGPDLLESAEHPATRRLVEAARAPRIERPAPPPNPAPLLHIEGLTVRFGPASVLDGVSLQVYPGETLALIGESGSGKTTLTHAVLRLIEPVSGSIHYAGRDVLALRGPDLKAYRREVALVMQEPALNPAMRAWRIVAEGPMLHKLGGDYRAHAETMLARMGLPPDAPDRKPGSFSGGQQQRISIARALAVNPRLLLLDEPASALDPSTELRILRGLSGLTLLIVAHDLRLVRRFADRVAVLYRGRLVETGPTEQILAAPQHAHTRALVEAVPTL